MTMIASRDNSKHSITEHDFIKLLVLWGPWLNKARKLKGDRVISPAVVAKNTTNTGRNDAVTLY